jgi:hypothetical protein
MGESDDRRPRARRTPASPACGTIILGREAEIINRLARLVVSAFFFIAGQKEGASMLVMVGTRLSPKAVKSLTAQAKREKRSISELIRTLVEREALRPLTRQASTHGTEEDNGKIER